MTVGIFMMGLPVSGMMVFILKQPCLLHTCPQLLDSQESSFNIKMPYFQHGNFFYKRLDGFMTTLCLCRKDGLYIDAIHAFCIHVLQC